MKMFASIGKAINAMVLAVMLVSCSGPAHTECDTPPSCFVEGEDFQANAVLYRLSDDSFTLDFISRNCGPDELSNFPYERFVVGYSPSRGANASDPLGYEGELSSNQVQPLISIDQAVAVFALRGKASLFCDEAGMLWVSALQFESVVRSELSPIEAYSLYLSKS